MSEQGQDPTVGGQEPQNQQQTAAASAQDGQEPEIERFDAEYVRKLRAEAAEYRRRLRELEQKAQEQENAKLSEAERLQKRLAELEREQATYQRERQERTLRYEVMLAANRLGIVDPDAAYRLLDVSRIEFAEDGTPANIEVALRELLKARPYLSAGQAVVAATNPARGQASVLTREDIRKMSPEEINRRWEEVSRGLAEGR